VGNLLELERALQRDRVVDAAAEVEEVAGLAVLAGDLFDLPFLRDYRFDLLRNRKRRPQQLLGRARIDASEARRQMNREQVEGLYLREKTFGGGHADLGTAARIDLRIGLARDRRIDGVGQRQQMTSAAPPLFERGERVGGLAGLRHRYQHRAFVNRGAAIAELGRVIDLDRDARQLLD